VKKKFKGILELGLKSKGVGKEIRFRGQRGWGFSSVVERLPRKHKALGSVPSSEKKRTKKKKDLGGKCLPGRCKARGLNPQNPHSSVLTCNLSTQRDGKGRGAQEVSGIQSREQDPVSKWVGGELAGSMST